MDLKPVREETKAVRKLPRMKLIAAGGSIFLVAALFAYQYWSKPVTPQPTVETARVNRQDLSVGKSFEGILQSAKQRDVYATGTTQVKQIKKEIGSSVAAGEPVVLLDNSKALMALAQAESTLAYQENEYRQAITNKALWQQKLDEARKNLQRQQRAYDAGLISFEELENAYLETATFEKQTLGVDLKSIEVQLNKYRLAVKNARDALSATVITSPMAGTLLYMGVAADQSVTPGVHLFSVGDLEAVEAFCLVDPEDAAKIKEGQPVEISGPGLAEQKSRGHVVGIVPLSPAEKAAAGYANKVKIKIALDVKLNSIEQGRIIITIPTERRSSVLAVPHKAVAERGGKNVVFVYRDGAVQAREVGLGLTDGVFQEILSGLSADELIITSSLDLLTDQAKVKIKQP